MNRKTYFIYMCMTLVLFLAMSIPAYAQFYETIPENMGVKDVFMDGGSPELFLLNNGELWGASSPTDSFSVGILNKRPFERKYSNEKDFTVATRAESRKAVKLMDNVRTACYRKRNDTDNVYVIKNDNSLWVWGSNTFGQFGLGHKEPVKTPTKVMEDVKNIYVDDENIVYIIKNDNSLWGQSIKNKTGYFVKIFDNVKDAMLQGAACLFITENNDLYIVGVEMPKNPYFENATIHEPPDLLKKNVKGFYDEIFDDVVASTWNYYLRADGTVWRRSDGKSTQVMDHVVSIASYVSNVVFVKSDGELWGVGTFRDVEGLRAPKHDTPVKLLDNVKKAFIQPSGISYIGTDNGFYEMSNAKLDDKGNDVIDQYGDYIFVNQYYPRQMVSGGKAVSSQNTIKVMLNGVPLQLSNPINKDGRNYFQFRELLNAIGAEVEWKDDTKTTIGKLNGNIVEFTLNANVYKVNGIEKRMDENVLAFSNDGKIYLPLKNCCEGLGLTITWDENTNTIYMQ